MGSIHENLCLFFIYGQRLLWAAAMLVFMLCCFYWHSRRVADTCYTCFFYTSYGIKAALRDPSVVFLSTHQSGVNTHFCPTTCVRWKHSNGVERYSSACSFNDSNVVVQPPPSASMTATGHTPLLLMACVSVFACLRPKGQTSCRGKWLIQDTASLCPPVLARAVITALQAGNRLCHDGAPPHR